MKNLENKIAVITGGASGIGYGSARMMAEDGATVILLDINENVFSSAEKIMKDEYKAEGMIVDVRNKSNVEETIERIIKKYKKIDILHNNAGVNKRAKFEDQTEDVTDFIFGVNIYGVWNMTQAVYKYMKEQKYGRIINTSSVTGPIVCDEGMCAYSLTKSGILGFTRALAVEAAKYQITVNAIMPGYVRTPMAERSAKISRPDDPESALKDMAEPVPLKRLATIDDIGNLAAFLASDKSSYITGEGIVIDGGSTIPETFGILNAGS